MSPAATFWAQSRLPEVPLLKGARTFVIDDPDQGFIAPGTWLASPEELTLIREYPEEKLRVTEHV
jgi:hypothetical protein